MNEPATESECTICGAKLHRRWTLAEGLGGWSDENNSTVGGESPIEGVNTVYDWMQWHLDNGFVAEYSALSAAVSLATPVLLPWQHRHEAPPDPPFDGPVPWHCDEPMRHVPEGWVCRQCKEVNPTDSTTEEAA